MFRQAKPGEFTFKRDSAGVETVETRGLIIATTRGADHVEPAKFVSAWDVEMVRRAVVKAKTAGFWSTGTPAPTQSPVAVTIQV